MTLPIEAYWQGRIAHKENPDAVTWEHLLPYAVRHLTQPWLDGWRDEVGDYFWTPGGAAGGKEPIPLSDVIGKNGGICPYCWGWPLKMKKDGSIWCFGYPCCSIMGQTPNGLLIDMAALYDRSSIKLHN